MRLAPALTLVLALAAGCARTPVPTSVGPTVDARHAVVVSASRPASEVGCAILQRGGNAVDAAVATAFALAVTFPEAGNIGGGGFMLVHPGPGRGPPTFFDYRETAPAAATPTMFATGKPTPHALVGVPGTVRGLALAHQRLGRLPWRDLVLPAVQLAQDGFAIDAYLARDINNVLATSADFPELRRVFSNPSGRPWREGDRLTQPDLARTLRAIADQGPDAFYTGPIAEALAAEVKSGSGGALTPADLANYRAKERTPLRGTYKGHDVYAAPPPSSGGVALVQMLNVLETFDLRAQGRYHPQTLHTIVEAMRRAYRDRAAHLGDPDFVAIPPHLTSKDYAKQLAATIRPDRATPSADLASPGIPLAKESDQTTHFSVVDADGMAVSNTYTLEQSWGGRVVVKGHGFLLNNELGDFNPRPGHTDRRGTIGTPPNLAAPNKRPLSSMSPTIVVKDGRPVLITGSPGGRTIINTVLQVTLNVLEFQMSPRAAVDAPRMHHQWFPDTIRVEPALARDHAEALNTLRRLGHTITPAPNTQGDAHTIYYNPTKRHYEGIADKRKSGAAAGY